jgi:MGT family glycosyltransferase
MRFLFCSLDVEGFLFPLIGMASALCDRGHEVVFVSDSATATRLDAQGLRRFPSGALPQRHSFLVKTWWQAPAIAAQVRQIEKALTGFAADALVGNSLTLGPLLAAERCRLPVALLGFCTYLWPSGALASAAPADSAPPSPRQARLAWRHGDMIQWLDRARAVFGMPACGCGTEDSALLGDLFLLRSVPELEEGWERLPEKVHLVGSCLWEPDPAGGDAELAHWLAAADRGQPVLYVQHGRTFHLPSFWAHLKEALADLPYLVAVSASRLDADQGEIPANFLVRPHLPQGQVLGAARAVVAGANTTVVLGALQAGLPSLLIPSGGEQPDVAERWSEAGVAIVLDAQSLTPSSLRNAITKLLCGDGYRAKATKLAAAFSAVDSFALAADLLERLAMTGAPILRASAVPSSCQATSKGTAEAAVARWSPARSPGPR